MEIVGQIIGFIFAGFLLRLTYKLYANDKIPSAVLVAWASVVILLCSFQWFQGWAKSFIASNISSRLTALGEQVNTVQTTTSGMLDQLSNQVNVVQEKTTKMHKQLDDHQIAISKNQKELNDVQSKIRVAESNIFSQESDITNQFQRISVVQSDLTVAQTNLSFQQEKLTNVESLVDALYSNTEDEELSVSDTNKVIVLKLAGFQLIIIKLKFAPVPNSIQTLMQQNGSQIPLLPTMGQTKNVLFTKWFSGQDINGGVFHLRYIKDVVETNLIHNVMVVTSNSVSFDGFPATFQ